MSYVDSSVADAAKEVPYSPSYRVTRDGVVLSCRIRGRSSDKWRVLKPLSCSNGYIRVSILVNGKFANRYVHRLVLEAWVGPCPEGMEACHTIDANRTNCRLDNLRWDTRKNNIADREKHGSVPRGSQHHLTTLSESDVVEIRRMFRDGWNKKQIAKTFDSSGSTIGRILNGKSWTHVKLAG